MNTKGHGLNKYPAKSHARRVAENLKLSSGTIGIAGTPSLRYQYSDQELPFRQDRYFYYLTGCNEPDCYVLYDVEEDDLTLWLPTINEARVVWTGRGSTIEEALEKYDIDHAEYIDQQHHLMPAQLFCVALTESSDCCTGEPPRIADESFCIPTQELLDSGLMTRAVALRDGLLRAAMDACRVIKDEHEISLIRRANEITAAAHTAVLRGIHNFTNEAEVEAAYMSVCIARRAKEQAYAPIAGSGANGSMLHYGKNDEDFGNAETIVLDAGCEVHCYASDVTRTIPINRKQPGSWPSKEAENIYRLVEKVQEGCIREIRPGKDFLEIVRLSQAILLEGLIELGILKGTFEKIWAAGTVYGFFPHGLGHHLGLEVHDVSPRPHPPAALDIFANPPEIAAMKAGLPPLPERWKFAFSNLYPNEVSSVSATSILEPNMVITIEPGCYFNRFLLERFFLNNPLHGQFIDRGVLERYWKVGGVRIEDDILVTKDGYENLTTAPKGEEMLRVIREDAVNGGGGCVR
jgi:Xaa-Pro dipeptidase